MAGNKTDASTKPRQVQGEGPTSIHFDAKGRIVTAGETNIVNVFKDINDDDPTVIDDNKERVNAISVQSGKLATAGDDHVVRLFDLSKETEAFEAQVAQFKTPVRAVALNSSANVCAAGGEDMTIKVVTLLDSSFKELKGHDGTVRCLSFDPKGELLASSAEDGYVRMWNLASGEVVEEVSVMEAARGGAEVEQAGMYGVAFNNQGNLLAVCAKNTVQLFSRMLEFKFELKDLGHETRVSTLSWSRDDVYLASADVTGCILVWEIESKQSLARLRHPTASCVTGLTWSPLEDSLAYADVLGQIALWHQPVRESVKAKLTDEQVQAQEKMQQEQKQKQELDSMFDDDDDDKRTVIKRPARSRMLMDDSDDEGDGVVTSHVDNFIVPDHPHDAEYAPAPAIYQQEPFQPSASPLDQARRFLVWNDLGTIATREEETTAAVDVEFHDTNQHRPIRLVDHFGFTMGALSEQCFALAAQSHEPDETDTRDHPSVLFCRNLSNWASDETWQVFFPVGEEIEVVAVGGGETGFVAVATNKRYVRLYTNHGVARHVFCLGGNVVTMSAFEEKLFVAYHDGAGANGEQQLTYLIFDCDAHKVIAQSTLPLTPAAELRWVGFSETGLPVTVDSEEVVRALVTTWDNLWTPVAELKNLKTEKQKLDYYWPVGMTATELLCVTCRGGETFPKVLPKPTLDTVTLQIPLVGLAETATHEEQFLRGKIMGDHTIEAEALDELNPADNRLILQQHKELDRHLLAAISRSIQSSRSARALDIATCLLLPASVDIAIKLAVKSKMPKLAERMLLAKQALEQSLIQKRKELRRARLGPRVAMRGAPMQQRPAAHQTQHMQRSPPAEDGSLMDNDDDDNDDNDDTQSGMEPVTPAERRPVSSSLSSKPAAKTAAPAKRPKAVNPFAKKAATVTPTRTTEANIVTTEESQDAEEEQPSAKKAKPAFSLKSKTKKPTADKAKPRKLSKYMNWLKHTRKSIKEDFPGLSVKELAKKAGELWREMDVEEQNKWDLPAVEA
eukprot:TRINITY_DN11524_c0_g2_i2.p1 TRINITY_DN11524_c0_g2~~TRINITY_DN11524_c0_g2_i2.p1  ORF type:complete len:1032 (+),score=334.37 TRINITY_DN11524_c0_g2_i2:48-3098(+)